jgi:TATA-box binding protein (TBP) (component of TFIID and TFIIIB)
MVKIVPTIRIVNVVARVKTEHLDLYKMSKANKKMVFDQELRLAWHPTVSGHGKLTLMKGGITIAGAKSVSEAKRELGLCLKRLNFYYVDYGTKH